MLAVIFPQPNEFTIADVPEPEAGPGEVLARLQIHAVYLDAPTHSCKVGWWTFGPLSPTICL